MVSSGRTSVFVADDHPLFLAGITAVIKSRPDLELVGSATDGREALEQLRVLLPEVAVLDLRMPSLDGNAVVNAIVRDGLPVKTLLLSAHIEGHLVYEALAHGANGFLSKLTDEQSVCDAVVAIARGQSVIPQELQAGLIAEIRGRKGADRPRLTEREQTILALLAEGKSAPMIADELFLSTSTVRTHLQALYDKLEVSTQAAAVAVAMRQGLLE